MSSYRNNLYINERYVKIEDVNGNMKLINPYTQELVAGTSVTLWDGGGGGG
jgi:hypothetical protein